MGHNNLEYWVWFLIIGGVIGWLAGLIVKGRGFGLLGDIVVGVVGGVLGGWLARTIGIFPDSNAGAFFVALVGAVVLVGVTRFIVRQA
jgi:uncharacterized membrane protein YeaQ/YmgE (transglycosylase-associated protein family)